MHHGEPVRGHCIHNVAPHCPGLDASGEVEGVDLHVAVVERRLEQQRALQRGRGALVGEDEVGERVQGKHDSRRDDDHRSAKVAV